MSEEKQPNYPPQGGGTFVLDDFSQSKINHGQQEINYYISDTDEKIVKALREFRTVVAKLAPGPDELKDLDDAIDAVSNATKKIAGPFPPGCLPPKPFRLPDE
ncbi:MAG TPA: hypothetical protein VJS13_04410 [Pyrinomonadaceae bacterium]|nr:hypothetical protein [Pyrinomonadaceae bacterium]